MVWSGEQLLEYMGLGTLDHKPYAKKKLHIDKGEVDPRSMGGVAVVSKGDFDDEGLLNSLSIDTWFVHPDSRVEKVRLIEIETEKLPGSKRGPSRVGIKNIWISGKSIRLNENNISIVLDAVRQIHVSLREKGSDVPHIAEIFERLKLEENVIGQRVLPPVFDLEHRIRFSAVPNFNIQASGKKDRPQLEIPLEAFMPLAGMRKNTLDRDASFMGREFIQASGVIPQVGRRFSIRSTLGKRGKKEKASELSLTQKDADSSVSNDNGRTLVHAHWKVKKAGEKVVNTKPGAKKRGGGQDDDLRYVHDTVRLKNLSILGHNMLRRSFREAMAAIGLLNRTHSDMLKSRDYPHMQDHLATYGLLDVVDSTSKPPDKDGRFVMTSIGGNNLKEIYPGIGHDIGGNCKTAETQWVDRSTGEVQKVGAILDFGSYLIKQHSEWSAGHPDVVEKLKHCKDIFITHHHLDHIDALIPYIKRGLFTQDHTIHMTPEVYEMLHKKLVKWGIKKDDPRRPNIHKLEGTGVIDITDEKGVKRLSVLYGVDAVPHSAKDTPFVAYGRNGDQILGSYMYLGDMRYDENWFAIHDSPFWDPVKVMSEREPALNPEHLIPTYTELDGTSVKREGRGADERDVEKNLSHILKNWFHDRHAGVAIIGTNDGRRETLLRVGNWARRKMTTFGSAVEDLFRVANKYGANPYLVDRPDKFTGIDDFLSWHAEQEGLSATEYKGRTSGAVKSWFKDDKPGSIMAVLSGSQGNPIEIESTTFKLSEGRSFLDADPQKSKTARPADLKDWVIIFSQSAIPGNGKYQRKLIDRLAGRGACVIEAFDDNIRVHNPKKLKKRILDDLVAQGRVREGEEGFVVENDGATIMVKNFAIHASGHGRKEDMRLWLHKLKAKYFGLHHIDNDEAVLAGYDLIEMEGENHPGRIFQNGEEIEIGLDSVVPIGRTISSVILTKEISEPGKHYNMGLQATRVFNFDEISPHHELGLMGTVGGPHEVHFGVEDEDEVRKRAEKSASDPDDTRTHSDKTAPKPPRQYGGRRSAPTIPWNPSHPLFSETEGPR